MDLTVNPLLHFKIPPRFCAKTVTKPHYPFIRSQKPQQQLNLSVLRFTFGIPGLDESYLPRWIGYGFGSLLLLNHFVGSDLATISSAQLSWKRNVAKDPTAFAEISQIVTNNNLKRTEALGLSLSALSISLPYFGRFLKGASPSGTVATLPQGAQQIFLMPENSSSSEDFAWASYVLLRNTNTVAVLILVEEELCVRGYWNTPTSVSKPQLLDWFKRQIENIGLSGLKGTLYFPQVAESQLWEMLPQGSCSILVEPLLQGMEETGNGVKISTGFVLVASSIEYAYSDKDKAWIRAILNKFRDSDTSKSL